MLQWRRGPGGHEQGRVTPAAPFGLIAGPDASLDSEQIEMYRPGRNTAAELIDVTNVIGWRAACSCGWAGQHRYPRRVRSHHPTRPVEIAILVEWDDHVRQQTELTRLLTAIAAHQGAVSLVGPERADLDHHLAEALHAARQVATWQKIADTLGVTRQAAFTRLGRYLPESGDRHSVSTRMVLPLTDAELRARYAAGATLRQLAEECEASTSLIWRRIHFIEEAGKLVPSLQPWIRRL